MTAVLSQHTYSLHTPFPPHNTPSHAFSLYTHITRTPHSPHGHTSVGSVRAMSVSIRGNALITSSELALT